MDGASLDEETGAVDAPSAPGTPFGADRLGSGSAAERLAADFLVERGLERLEGNWRRRLGEIDLVMREPADGTIVFVEVRYRARAAFGGALESVDRTKRAKLRRSALAWLQHHADPDDPARIDVVAIEPAPSAASGGTGASPEDGSGGYGHAAGLPDRRPTPSDGRVVARRDGLTIEWVVGAVEDDD